MSIDDTLRAPLAHQSEDAAVNKALNVARGIDRSALSSELAHIEQSELTPLEKADARAAAAVKHEKTANDIDGAIVEAFVAVQKSRPPFETAKTAGEAAHDSAMLGMLLAVPLEQREKLLKSSPELQMAAARAPRILTGLGEQTHEDVKDTVRRRLWPADAAKRDADLAALQAARLVHEAFRETAKGLFSPKKITSAHQIQVTPANLFVEQ